MVEKSLEKTKAIQNQSHQDHLKQQSERIDVLEDGDDIMADGATDAQNRVAHRDQIWAKRWKELVNKMARGEVRMGGKDPSGGAASLPAAIFKQKRAEDDLLTELGGQKMAGTPDVLRLGEAIGAVEGFGEIYVHVVPELFSLAPGVGEARDAYEVSTGTDIYGNELSTLERSVTAGMFFVPWVPTGPVRRFAKRLFGYGDEAIKAAKAGWRRFRGISDEVGDGIKAADNKIDDAIEEVLEEVDNAPDLDPEETFDAFDDVTPKGVGPDDPIPDGISFDITNPKHRQFKSGDNILEYTLEGGELSIDWVSGKNASSMMKAILDAEGNNVRRISGYVTGKLGEASDEALQRLGNLMASQLGNGWKATIEIIEGRRYLVFTR